MENPYEWSTDQLLSEFMNACGRTGFSNSGLVISFTAGDDRSRAYYLRSVVHARIDQAIPPIKSGDQVLPKERLIAPLPVKYEYGKERELPKLLTVAVVRYKGNGQWTVTFVEQNDATAYKDQDDDGDRVHKFYVPLQFKAEDFEVLTPVKA